MTSLIEPTNNVLQFPVSASEDGDRMHPQSIAVLAEFVEFMRPCGVCECEQIFRAGWECANGLLGCCLGCGDEQLIPFTRTSEVAI